MKSSFKIKALVAAAMLAGAMTGTAHAASTSGTFQVDINLTSACSVSTINNVAFAYTSFGAAANAAGGGFTVTCTNTLPYTFGLQTGNGAPTPPGAATINVTDDAVNLAYTLGTSAAGGTGSGAIQAYTVTGTMAAGQGGTCGAATCTNAAATNRIHTLIVNW